MIFLKLLAGSIDIMPGNVNFEDPPPPPQKKK